jgi:hypothetical protein
MGDHKDNPEIYDWFTAYGRAELTIIFNRRDGENVKTCKTRMLENKKLS